MALAFALVMAIVLAVTGVVIYRTFRSDLGSTEEHALSSRSEELTALVRRASVSAIPSLSHVGSSEDEFAQVLRPDGRVLAATPQVPAKPVLEGANLRRAAHGELRIERGPIEQLDGRVRVQALPVESPLGRVVVVVGTPLGEREEELSNLVLLLVGGGLAALLLASLAGYGVATAALRPVDAMRRRAATISQGAAERLPVPRSGDEIARLGTTLNDMLDRLNAAFARERVFVADASHQLRTPLAILKAEIELALREGRSPEELRAALESAAEETDRLARLAEDLLVIARLDQGSVDVADDEVDVEELLEGAARRASMRAHARGLSMSIADSSGVRLRGDRVRLEQALENMLDNALRFAHTCVRLDAHPNDGRVELHVRDDGPGFEHELIAHAFERFSRGQRDDPRAGTGLGLAIVAVIARSHGGEARAANLPGGGADVWIELAAAPVSQDAARAVSGPVLR